MKEIRILVSGVGGPAGISAARLLAREEGVKVFGVDADEAASGRLFVEDFRVVALANDGDAYARSLNEAIAFWQIDAVVPTVSEELSVVTEVVGDNALALVSPKESVELCARKSSLYTAMAGILPEALARWQKANVPLEWDAPHYFLKPDVGRGGRGCRRVTRFEAMHSADILEVPQNWILMEDMPGQEWTVDVYVGKEGEAHFIVPRERLALSGGISLKGRTVRHEKIITRTERILKEIPFRGPLCLQFKERADGSIGLVEINARLSGGILITAASGANPMHCFIEELRGENLTRVSWQEKTSLGFIDYRSA